MLYVYCRFVAYCFNWVKWIRIFCLVLSVKWRQDVIVLGLELFSPKFLFKFLYRISIAVRYTLPQAPLPCLSPQSVLKWRNIVTFVNEVHGYLFLNLFDRCYKFSVVAVQCRQKVLERSSKGECASSASAKCMYHVSSEHVYINAWMYSVLCSSMIVLGLFLVERPNFEQAAPQKCLVFLVEKFATV